MKIGTETEILEFKKTTAELKEGVISMSAILNKHGGGEIYFGIHNNGTVLGQQIGDATLRDISQAVSSGLEPKIFPTIKVVYLDNKPCIHIAFTGDDAPYFAYGRTYIRVAALIKIAEKYIIKNIRWRVVFDGSLQRNEIPEIPMDAVREVIINSFCHRDYKSSQNNEVTIHSNRIEIYNPGTFPDGLTPNDFIGGTARSIKRNPLLAQLMYYVKDIESFGTGLKRITDACNAAGVKVEFKMLKLGFSVIFYRPEISISDGKIDDKQTNQDTGQDTTTDTTTESNNLMNKILSFCMEPQSRIEIQLFIGLKNKNHFLKKYLNPLIESGKLRMTIPDKPNSKNQKYIRSENKA
ncbi:MAG: putative DNA binding domain-containing protein [Treponema sp.]|nr:putative DNA binding domain-containing protein [Treponema sp.]